MIAAAAAVYLITLHGPHNQQIDVNPDSIVSMREPQEKNEDYLHAKSNCVLSMSNGKLISVVEDCSKVRSIIEDRRTKP
jgi:hypothetical protein